MEHQLSMNEAKVFDDLISQIKVNQYELVVDQLSEIFSKGKSLNYEYYLEKLKKHNLIEYSEFNARYRISGNKIEIEKLNNSGGFVQIVLKEQKELKEKEQKTQLEMLKLILENKNLQWQLNTKWYVLSIAVIGGICGIISLIMNLIE
jgi:hypothetical protein